MNWTYNRKDTTTTSSSSSSSKNSKSSSTSLKAKPQPQHITATKKVVTSDFSKSRISELSSSSESSSSSCEPWSRRVEDYSGRSPMDDGYDHGSFVGGINQNHRYHQSDIGTVGFRGPTPLSFRNNIALEELSSVAPLGHGGFCVVCSCVYRGQRAVLKMPQPHGPEGTVADLLVEISIYERISTTGGHANVTRAFGAGLHYQQGQRLPFLLLERLDGGTLADAIERSRPPSGVWTDPSPRLPLALEVANALTFLHNDAVPGGFILHRDLKPANIGLCAGGHAKVFDLGLSALREVRNGRDNKYQMSGMAGSKRFMAPEVCQGLQYNEKVDVYSFGIVMWEILALRKPFAGMGVADHYREVIVGGLRPPLDPRWPTSLNQLLQSCWHPDPDYRPTILETRESLRQIIENSSAGR